MCLAVLLLLLIVLLVALLLLPRSQPPAAANSSFCRLRQNAAVDSPLAVAAASSIRSCRLLL
jgi:hypothetical protein